MRRNTMPLKTQDEPVPRPPLWRSSISQPASPDFSASSSEDEDVVANVSGQQPQPCLWALPPKTPRRGGKKISHRDFRLTLIREMLARSGHEPQPSKPVGRPAPASTNILGLDTRHNKHWPDRNPTRRICRVCLARGVTRTVMFKCVQCDVGFVWTEVILRITTQKQLIRHLYIRATCKQLQPRPQCK